MISKKFICMVLAGFIFSAFLSLGNAAPIAKPLTNTTRIKKTPVIPQPTLKITKPETAPILTDPGDSVPSGEQRNVTWTSVPMATSYDFQWADKNTFIQAKTFECQVASSGFKQSAKNDPVVYYMRVRARNADGSSSWSNVVELTVLPELGPEVPPAAPVASLAPASVLSDQTYTLSWTQLDGLAWYEYLESRDPKFKERYNDCTSGGKTGSSISFHHEVNNPQKYYYRVRCGRISKDPAKSHPMSEWSNVVEVTINPRN
jgi:predicted phage tail protein